MSAPLADQAHRDIAVTGFAQNLSVTAGAGAGKTSLLVERILWAILDRGLSLERIVAITFTEKAASELRQRVQVALAAVEKRLALPSGTHEDEAGRVLARLQAGAEPRPAETLGERVRQARRAPCTLTTIHGFAGSILRRWPRVSGLSPDFEVDEGAHWQRFFQKEWPVRIRRRLEAGSDADLQRTLALMDLATLRDIVFRLAEFPGDASKGRVTLAESGLAPRLQDLAGRLRQYLEVVDCGRARKYLEHMDRCAGLLERTLELGADGLEDHLSADHLEFLEQSPPRPPTKLEGAPREQVERDFTDAFQLLRGLARVQEADTEAILRVAAPLAQGLAEDFVHEGRVTFDGILTRTHRLLSEQEPVRTREAARLDLLLIDEFQDTDARQCEIALLLCAAQGGAKVSAWQRPLVPGRLFLVGDPKQGIYRFRGADLETYHRAVRRVEEAGGRSLTLTVSFRSPRQLVEPLNHLFRQTFDPSLPADPRFDDLHWVRDADTDEPLVELWSVEEAEGRMDAAGRRRLEGLAITQRIQEWHAQGVPYGHVAILLRSLSDLPAYLRPLRSAGIPTVVAGGRTFGKRSEVHEFLALLEALADPTDAVAMVGALRSSRFAIPDPELAAWADTWRAHGKVTETPWSWPLLADSDHPALREAADEYLRLRQRLHAEPLGVVLEDLADQSGLLARSCAAADGPERQRNLRKLLDLVTRQVETLGLPLSEVMPDLRDGLQGAQGESESNLADEGHEAVHILTIHKAKGLEFPRVLVADLGHEEQSGRSASVEVGALPSATGIRPALALASLQLANTAMVARQDQERAHQLAEAKRLLYVALTRAQERLVLVNAWPKVRRRAWWLQCLRHWGYVPEDGFPPDGSADTQVPVRHRRIASRPASPPAGGAHRDPGDWRASVHRLQSCVDSLAKAAPRWFRPSQAEGTGDPEVRQGWAEDEALLSPKAAPDVARAVGIACHRILQWRGPAPAWDQDFLERCAAQVATEEGLATAPVLAGCQEILERPALRDLLGTLGKAQVLARELPILATQEARWGRGVVDLVLREGDRVVVLDYKTDADAEPEQLRSRYATQLRWYGSAVQQALGLKDAPRLELILLRQGLRIPVPD